MSQHLKFLFRFRVYLKLIAFVINLFIPILDDHDAQPYKVRGPSGRTHFYRESEVTRAGGRRLTEGDKYDHC